MEHTTASRPVTHRGVLPPDTEILVVQSSDWYHPFQRAFICPTRPIATPTPLSKYPKNNLLHCTPVPLNTQHWTSRPSPLNHSGQSHCRYTPMVQWPGDCLGSKTLKHSNTQTQNKYSILAGAIFYYNYISTVCNYISLFK